MTVVTLGLAQSTRPARASGDDYPDNWEGITDASDWFHYKTQECTSFAAWREYRDGHKYSDVTGLGFAKDWYTNAKAKNIPYSDNLRVQNVAPPR